MPRDRDVALLRNLPDDKRVDLLFMHLRNLWAVDGLYFLEIEKRWGIQAATAIDETVWSVMGKIEARKLKEFFSFPTVDLEQFMFLLQHTSWALDLEDKEIEISAKRAVIRNRVCRVQRTRLSKGLPEFGCKTVRNGFLSAFAKECNPNLAVKCICCPPDVHPDDVWCEWEFRLNLPK